MLADADDGKPDVILLATGSEVSLCVAAYEQLNAEGIKARVVSMPSWELFEQQPDVRLSRRGAAASRSRRASPSNRPRRSGGRVMSGPRVRASGCTPSAPRPRCKELQKKFGFTVENVVAAARSQVARTR